MTIATLSDQMRILATIAGEVAARAKRAALAPWFALRGFAVRAPERLLIAPQDIRTSDPTIAEDVYAGYFAFSGRIVNAHGRSPFDLDPPSPAWSRGLLGFGWLRHLRAADTVLARANARALVDDFINHEARGGEPASEPKVAARRLISLLSQSPVILDGTDRAFYRRFMKYLAQMQARLQRQFDGGPPADARLPAALALAFYALCAQVPARTERRATRQLMREINAQILPDGGHVSRNPRPVVDLLLDFLPLRQAYAARGMDVPQSLMNAIDRMMPMLRMFRHGDGTLALFNGMGVTAPDTLAIALAYDDAHAAATGNARYSAYQRIEAAGLVAIMDAGVPPARRFSVEAHAGCLAFEVSDGDQRIIVNCGAPDPARIDMRIAARSTAAHSTLTLADTSSCQLARSDGLQSLLDGQILLGPRNVTVERGEDAEKTLVAATHDGYAAQFGLLHTRKLAMAHDGNRLGAEDVLAPARSRPAGRTDDFALRFHLHPNVAVRIEADGTAALLTLAGGGRWRFEAQDHAAALEESIYFAAANGPRATMQIVIHGRVEREARVAWSLRRVAGGEA